MIGAGTTVPTSSAGAWRPLDSCRIMRSSTVYDTYQRSTRALTARFDESEPGWITAITLNSPGAVWVKFATNGSGQVLRVYMNNQWQDVRSLLPARPLIAGTPGTIGGGTGGGLTHSVGIGAWPIDKLAQYIGKKTQGKGDGAYGRIMTAPVCTAYDRIHNNPRCPKI